RCGGRMPRWAHCPCDFAPKASPRSWPSGSTVRRRSESRLVTDNVLATIPGEYIARAAISLPEARDASAEPQQVAISIPPIEGRVGNRRVRITFKQFKHKRGKATRYFWTAEHAEVVGP